MELTLWARPRGKRVHRPYYPVDTLGQFADRLRVATRRVIRSLPEVAVRTPVVLGAVRDVESASALAVVALAGDVLISRSGTAGDICERHETLLGQ